MAPAQRAKHGGESRPSTAGRRRDTIPSVRSSRAPIPLQAPNPLGGAPCGSTGGFFVVPWLCVGRGGVGGGGGS